MLYNEIEKIIEKIVKDDTDKDTVIKYLTDNLDWEEIYDSDDLLLTDSFFALKHYAYGEEEISLNEWLYFLECLSGKREYDMKEKIALQIRNLTAKAD